MQKDSVDKFKLKVGGVEDVMLSADVVELTVETNLFMPAMFTFLLDDHMDPRLGLCKYIDLDPRFIIGTSIEIGLEDPNGLLPIKQTLIKGEITSLEPVFTDGKTQLRVRGYDKCHRMMRDKQTRSFLKMKDSDILVKMAAESGVIAKIKDTSIRFDYLLQYNQSNWDFLCERAKILGLHYYSDGMNLIVCPADSSTYTSTGPTLKLGDDLRHFEPRIVSSGQLTKATVRGWDPKTKKEVEGTESSATSQTSAGVLLAGSQTTLLAFGSNEEVILDDKAVRSKGEADKMAAGHMANNQNQFIRASGDLDKGNPSLQVGAKANIQGVGLRFSGSYFITGVRHTWRAGKYSEHFEVTGSSPYTLRHLIGGDTGNTSKIYGVVPAIVTNIQDNEKLGRVKVKFSWMPKSNGTELESDWVRLATPSAGAERGFFFTPEVDDEVLIAFEHGDVNFPYIVGSLWNGKDKPPKGTAEIIKSGTVNQRVVRSRSGHLIIMDDTQGEEQIIIQDKSQKNSISFNTKEKSVTIKAEGDLTIEAGGKLILSSKSDFSLKSEAKAAIESTQGANIKAGQSQLDLQAAGAALKGTKIDVQGQTQVNVTANAQVSVKGNAMVEVQGGIVKIN